MLEIPSLRKPWQNGTCVREAWISAFALNLGTWAENFSQAIIKSFNSLNQ